MVFESPRKVFEFATCKMLPWLQSKQQMKVENVEERLVSQVALEYTSVMVNNLTRDIQKFKWVHYYIIKVHVSAKYVCHGVQPHQGHSEVQVSTLYIFYPYAAGTEYIRFQANFRPINSTRIVKMFCGRCSVNLIITFWRCVLFINIFLFRHLELEIALAISDPNDEK